MIEVAYNNAKNVRTGHTLFDLNYVYHFRVLFDKNINFQLKSRFTDKLAKELRELINIYYQIILLCIETTEKNPL